MSAEYKVVSGRTPSELETNVATEIGNSFAPCGGVAIDTRKIDPVYIQGMYKSE